MPRGLLLIVLCRFSAVVSGSRVPGAGAPKTTRQRRSVAAFDSIGSQEPPMSEMYKPAQFPTTNSCPFGASVRRDPSPLITGSLRPRLTDGGSKPSASLTSSWKLMNAARTAVN